MPCILGKALFSSQVYGGPPAEQQFRLLSQEDKVQAASGIKSGAGGEGRSKRVLSEAEKASLTGKGAGAEEMAVPTGWLFFWP